MISKNINIILFLLLSLFGFSASGQGIVVLKSSNAKPYNLALEGFKSVNNLNISEFVLSEIEGNDKDLIKQIESFSPDAVFAIGTAALIFANDKIKDIPIVYSMVYSPEKHITRNRNITGIDLFTPIEFQACKLKLLFPDKKRIGVMFNPVITGDMVNMSKKIFNKYGIVLISQNVNNPKYVPKVLRKLTEKIDLLWLLPDSTVLNKESFEYISLYCLQKGIPVVSHSVSLVKLGCIAAFSADYYGIGKQSAEIVKNIVVNNKEYPQVIELTNMKLFISKVLAKEYNVEFLKADIVDVDEKVFIYDFKTSKNINSNNIHHWNFVQNSKIQ